MLDYLHYVLIKTHITRNFFSPTLFEWSFR